MRKLLPVIVIIAAIIALFSMQYQPALAATIFFDNFNSGYSGWSTSSSVNSQASPAIQPNSVRLRQTGAIWRTVSTVGYTGISLTWNMAASSLENGERCHVEVNTGSGWNSIASITNGQDNSTFFSGTVALASAAENNANLQIRYRIAANAVGDYCYGEDITLSGSSGPTATPANTPTPISGTVPGDPLTGSGDVTRTLLTYTDLNSSTAPSAPVDDSAFALPAEAAMPSIAFEGRLELSSEATSGGFSEVRDDYSYTNATDSPRKHLPEFSFEFVQNGSHLIPVTQGLSISGHQYWNYIVGPGRVWRENSDNGWMRASFPFALVQRNSNCTHNGVMTFLFNATSISKVRYQITQETCVYYKINMWGQLNAAYALYAVANSATYKDNHATEVGNRLPTKSIADLASDYPSSGVNVSVFGSGVTATHMTAYGVYFNGVNYISGCGTRYGQYAYCEQMRLPSYSTAKSAFASMALMRLGQLNGTGVYNLLIRNYVSEYTQGGVWTNVTFNNTIDMATGNYTGAGYEVDEAGSIMSNFFLAEPYSNKIGYAFAFPGKTTPGTLWVYHSSDTFIVTRAMSNYYGSDIFNLVRDSVFGPLKLNAGALTTERTDNSASGVPFGGYGLFWTQDDIAKVARLLNNDHGVIDGAQILEPSMLDDSMQDDPTDRGVDTTGATVFKYNNGFWAKQFTTADGYACSFYTPFMSGYGGITVVMMPNGATYYYFSDNEEYSWASTVAEANKLAPQCP